MPRTLEFFAGSTTAAGIELWATDGTTAGTTLVSDIVAGSNASNPRSFVPTGTGVLFIGNDLTANGAGLFFSNGTAAGTVELKNDLIRGPVTGGHLLINPPSLNNLVPFTRGRALFTGATSTGATQLFVTDGTVAGTRLLASFGPSYNVAVQGITLTGNGRAVFNVSFDAAQPGLWATDGTLAGTVRLSASPATPTFSFAGKVLTTAADGSGGTVLGVTDGTVAGTTVLRDFPRNSGATLSAFAQVGNGQAVFTYYANASDGTQLWVTDGTAAGTTVLAGQATTPQSPYGLNPTIVTGLSTGKVLFSANDGTANDALWITDGTVAGTKQVIDLNPGTGSSSFLTGVTPLGNGRALVRLAVTQPNGYAGNSTTTNTLYATDGTAAGTVALLSTSGTLSYTIAITAIGLPNGNGVFATADAAGQLRLYTTDGTTAGTAQFAQFTQGTFAEAPSFTTEPNGKVGFTVTDQSGAKALWSTAGTAASTVQLAALTLYNTPVIATVPDIDPLFDTNFYLARSPDVAASNVTAAQHYLQFGGAEGRPADPFFDSRYYLLQNPDVKAAGLNPLLHFEQFGWREGRDPSLLFSTKGYLAANPDVAAAKVDPLLHYLQFGQAEGRAAPLAGGSAPADPLIQASFYDPQLGAVLIPTGVGAAQQAAFSFETTGWQQGLNPDPLFDVSYYLAKNPDVKASGVDPLLHYEQFGWQEGRNPSAAFSVAKYLAANPDVAAARVDPLAQYFSYGMAEGRAIYPV